MDRRSFLTSITGGSIMLKELGKMSSSLNSTVKMPVLFLGHGSPMNAIEENEFVQGFRNTGKEIAHPQAILCISAHWETPGTKITAMEHPKTIHDFGGFPRKLYEVEYPAPGNPDLAKETKNIITKTDVELDHAWGLDHGAWSVIRHMYPNADIPVIQMSLDYRKSPQFHYELAKELAQLRKKGVLIVGSGNIVHNLRMVEWSKLNTAGYGHEWAIEANEKMKEFMLNDNHQALIKYHEQGRAFQLAIPTPEHYLPLLYALALKDKNDELELFNDKPVGGSVSMTSLKLTQS